MQSNHDCCFNFYARVLLFIITGLFNVDIGEIYILFIVLIKIKSNQ